MDAKKTWEITEQMIQGQFTADASEEQARALEKKANKSLAEKAELKNLWKQLESEARAKALKARKRGDTTMASLYQSNAEHYSNKALGLDANPVKTGGYVQRELEERLFAGWAKRSGGKEPGWYVYQDGQSYAGPYDSKAKGEEGLRLANRLHPGHKYDLRVLGTKDANPQPGPAAGKKTYPRNSEERRNDWKYTPVSEMSEGEIRKEIADLEKRVRVLTALPNSHHWDRSILSDHQNRIRELKKALTKDANPMEMLKAVNEAQKALQRAEKGSAEYNAAKKKLDALVAEMAKANRAFEAAGGKYKRSTEGQANRANADAAPHTPGAVGRWRSFNSMVKAVQFGLWCDKNGIRVTKQEMLGPDGGTIRVEYESTNEQERKIPAVFDKR